MRRFCFSAILFISLLSSSQNLYYTGFFPTIDHSGDLNDKMGYGLYYFAAFPARNVVEPDSKKDFNFLLFYSEQSLTFNASKKVSFTGSYVYQRANAVYDNYINESRFYVQAKYKHTLKNWNVAHRLRFDGRFIRNRLTDQTPFTHRLRYLIGLDIPLKTKNANAYFAMYQEFFFNTVSKARPVYEENWAYAGIGVKINEIHKLEPGILYITWYNGNNSWFNQYYLQLTWVSHLDLSRKRK